MNTPQDTPTHVLMWVPRHLMARGSEDGSDGWDMQTYADAVAGTPQDILDAPDFPQDVAPLDLCNWVENRLGHPVVLVASTEVVKRSRWSLRSVTVPSYYVFPAGVRS